jgi:hypothetical protein
MPTTKQCDDHVWVLEQLKAAQEADHDMREQVREAHLFVDKRDGQWEPYWWDNAGDKPRYTFDLCNPIIDQVAGDMEKRDFDIRISPAGGDATKDTAKVYDGLVRNIESMSDAGSTYNCSGREIVTSGLSGWRVVQDYVDDDTFDQDLLIKKVGNWVDRVWFGPHEEQDASDATMCWVLTGMGLEEFKVKYPKRSQSASMDGDRRGNAYYYRNDLIMVGEFLYITDSTRELVLMSNSKVYEVDDDFKKVADELQILGVTEVRRRKRAYHKVYTRKFDANGWIEKARATIFENWIPVIPCYANFKVFEDKVIYWGVVEKMMDAQRVFNYSLSREIEEGALAPRQKYWMTEAQTAGHEAELATMNTNSDPVQMYNPDPEAPGAPLQSGGAMINPGLRTISDTMQTIVGQSAGMFAANMGDNPNLQSGVAIQALQDRGDTGNNKYITAREVAQRQTARILVNAIPRVYEPSRQVRLLKEDGSMDMVVIGEQVPDMQTQTMVTLNDLTSGTYDVVVSSGPSFKNRQNETVTALTEVGKIDPSVIELGGDILLGNIPSPGMDDLAARKRQQLFQAGAIPEDQLTDEERQQQQQMAQQPPPEDPMMVAARAEEQKAQADLVEAQTKQATAQADIQIKTKQIEIDAFNAETNRFEAQVKHAEAMANIKGKGAQAAKALAEAEAQDIENDAVTSGVMDLVESVSNG